MALYSRHQLLILLALVATFGGGLAVERWRHAHPEIVERVERFDRAGAAENAIHPTTPHRSNPGRLSKLRTGGNEESQAPIDLNQATLEELTRLPGVGPELATRIVEARLTKPFVSLDDLRRVQGLGQSRLERLRGLISVEPR